MILSFYDSMIKIESDSDGDSKLQIQSATSPDRKQ